MASETEDNDSSLGDILQASDNLSRAISLFKKIVEGQDINGELELPEAVHNKAGTESSTDFPTLIDLGGFESSSPVVDSEPPPIAEKSPSALIPILPPPPIIPTASHTQSTPIDQTLTQMSSASNSMCLLDEELLHLGLDDPPSNGAPELPSNSTCDIFQVDSGEIDFFTGPALEPVITKAIPLLAQPAKPIASPTITSQSTPTTYPALFNATPALCTAVPAPASPAGGIVLHELEVLGQQLLEEAKGASAKTTGSSVALNAMPTFTVVKTQNPVATVPPSSPYCSVPIAPGSSIFPPHQQESPQKGSHISLANVTVPLETIKTSSLLPVTAYDKNGFRILLHFAKDCPPDRPDVLVVVISMLNTAPLPIQNILFQAAVPKTMKVKLQTPSGTEMAAFNPVLPPASVTQVMLLANPLKEKVRLRYKLSFSLGEECSTEVGEVDNFPSPDLWGKL
ncbi:unnamed protein product [Staurois parvus]|nr:unnamed protein product [Staurois parvus]